MNTIKYFIDTNLLNLDYLKELDKTANSVEYFYPCVDAYLLTKDMEQKISKKIEEFSNKIGFRPRINFNKKEIEAIKKCGDFNGRFSVIYLPQITNFAGDNFVLDEKDGTIIKIPTFSNFGILHSSGRQILRYNKTLKKLRELFPNLSYNNKDFHVLSTVLSCEKGSALVRTFTKDNGRDKEVIDLESPKEFFNDNGKKYFLSLDTKGFFSKNSIKQIEKEFKSIKIYNANSIDALIEILPKN